MSIHDEVNLIIFRIPDAGPEDKENKLDDGFRLVELPYLDKKLAKDGTIFMPHANDEAYRSIEHDRIVLARSVTEGSIELIRYQIVPDNPGVADKFYQLGYEDLIKAVTYLVAQYDAERIIISNRSS